MKILQDMDVHDQRWKVVERSSTGKSEGEIWRFAANIMAGGGASNNNLLGRQSAQTEPQRQQRSKVQFLLWWLIMFSNMFYSVLLPVTYHIEFKAGLKNTPQSFAASIQPWIVITRMMTDLKHFRHAGGPWDVAIVKPLRHAVIENRSFVLLSSALHLLVLDGQPWSAAWIDPGALKKKSWVARQYSLSNEQCAYVCMLWASWIGGSSFLVSRLNASKRQTSRTRWYKTQLTSFWGVDLPFHGSRLLEYMGHLGSGYISCIYIYIIYVFI